jgi:hypothetical protein
MRKCRVQVFWSEKDMTECNQDINEEGDTECYHHKKYFEGLSKPCYLDLRSGEIGVEKNHILSIYSPERMRTISFL